MSTDADAEREMSEDLSGPDFAQFKLARFEFEAKSERVNMRLPKALRSAVKETALHEGIPYQRFIRQVLEQAVTASGKAPHRR